MEAAVAKLNETVELMIARLDGIAETMRRKKKLRIYRVEKESHTSIFKDVPDTAPSKESSLVEALNEESTLEASLIKQLQKTKADVFIWQLILSSFEHRQVLLQALMNMTVSPSTTPDDMVTYVAQSSPQLTNAVTFSDEDLPPFGPKHCLAMYIAVVCLQKHIPMTLVDDGSAVNVLPLRTAHMLGLDKKDFTSTTQMVRAFNGTIRRVSGIIDLVIQTGSLKWKEGFQITDVASSFNLLLGRPWIHAVRVVSSILHRKIKIPFKDGTITIDATPIVVAGGEVTSEVSLESANDTCAFEVISTIESNPELGNMDLYTGSHISETILRTEKYFSFYMYPRREDTFVLKPAIPKGTTFGLGYEPVEKDILTKKKKSIGDQEIEMEPYLLTLNGYFVRAGENEPCLDFPEPIYVWKNKRMVPGIKIFQDCYYIPEDVSAVIPENNDSTPAKDGRALGLLFGEERKKVTPSKDLVNMILRSDKFDPSTLITGVDPKRTISGWWKTVKWTENRGLLLKLTTGEGEMFKLDDGSEYEFESEFESESESEYESDKSPSNEIENEAEGEQVEEDEKEVEPPPQLVKGLEEYGQRNSVIEDTETIIVGTTLEPQKLKIGITLDLVEKQGFIDLLIEFKDIFPCSYKDMPGIDREIAEHRIPIKPGFKPVKQKLRRMRSEWSLKVKEEIDKQLKAGFIKVSVYSDWVANVVPVPKKDDKVRRTATTLLHDMMHKKVKVYVVDMIVKSKDRSGHLGALRKFFQRLRKYNKRLNPQKCAFGVTSGKLLGRIVSHHGIKVDPSISKPSWKWPIPRPRKKFEVSWEEFNT
ncbi:uncharacterized protein LOC141608102 [Silene latifolia]|uniref:uncharacterized protein LOC141608102 n=1 Tax=Silene latifolia TaxID=37657 RepID=UPI003D77634C